MTEYRRCPQGHTIYPNPTLGDWCECQRAEPPTVTIRTRTGKGNKRPGSWTWKQDIP